jgi:hypothetical protein
MYQLNASAFYREYFAQLARLLQTHLHLAPTGLAITAHCKKGGDSPDSELYTFQDVVQRIGRKFRRGFTIKEEKWECLDSVCLSLRQLSFRR